MPDYKKKTQSDNASLQNLVGARYKHIDGSVTTPVTVRAGAGRLLRVILNTTGATLILKDGTDVIGVISTTATTGTYQYGVYCNTSITITASGTCDATVVFDA